MKRTLFIATILLLSSLAQSVFAQSDYDLSPRNVEPARPRLIPYHNMAAAISGDASKSRFVAQLEDISQKESGTSQIFTTHFALPVNWLNRQTIIRVGYASSAYTIAVNGREIGFVPTGVMGAEFNITKASKEGRNEVVITLDKSLLANKLYEPKELKIEDIEVFTQPTIRLRDIVNEVRLNDNGEGIAEFAMPIKCDALNRKEARLHYTLRLNDSVVVAEGYRDIALDMRREDTLRFACIVPKSALWNAQNPTLLRLDVESRIDNRIAECVSQRVSLRQSELRKGKFYINGDLTNLNFVEYDAVKSLEEAKKYGYNGVIITLDKGCDAILKECNEKGLYAIVRTPIDTTLLGDDIRRDGNPSNDLLWSENYLWRNSHALHSTKGNGAVVGHSIAKGKTSGINIYDTYVMLKSLAPNALVIYDGAKGEWATDK